MSAQGEILFRAARLGDCADLALLADMATRRLTSHLWGMAAGPGQSVFEIGRATIRNNSGHFSHFTNWRVAEQDGILVGAFNGYIIPPPAPTDAAVPAVVKALNELKAMAAGSWYVAALALHPEYQGRGLGKALLNEAESLARAAGRGRLTLMVGSFNEQARHLYLRSGFTEQARRPFTAFPGSDSPGDWILMGKDLA